MKSTDNPAPPPGYIFHTNLFSKSAFWEKYPFPVILLLANFVALIPLAIGVILLWLPYQYYLHIGAPYALLPTGQLPFWGKLIVGGLIFFASMLLHEWLHGVALQICGHKPQYAFNKYYLLATIADGDYLTRREYLWMTITPLLVMTIGGGLLLLILPATIGQLLLFALLLNTAASVGDLMVAQRVYNAPEDAIFTDDQGIQVFLPLDKKEAVLLTT